MQWLKSAMVVSSMLMVAAAASTQGCSGGGGTKDGGPDAIVGKDGSSKDAPQGDGNTKCQSGLDCEVCDVTSYQPPVMGKPIQMKNSCTATQLQDFVTACFSTGATQATCTTWVKAQPDGGTCNTCLGASLQSDATWGPFDCQTTSSPCGANSGGCVDLVTNTVGQEKVGNGAGSCGDLITTNFGCQDLACGGCTSTDFTTCDQSAIANECKPFVDPQQSTTGACAAVNGDAAPAGVANCFPQTDADNVNFVNVFCGTGG